MACFSREPFKGGLMVLLALLPLLTSACQGRDWEPTVAFTVNGRPVPRSAVDQVLEWGFYSSLGRGGEVEGAVSLPQIIAKLVDEQLILAEAEKVSLTVSQAEIDQAEAFLGTAWFGTKPPPAELGDLRQALRNQLLVQKMTVRIMTERRVLSAAQWQVFWDRWPKNPAPRYQVRALMLPPSETPPELAQDKNAGLAKLAEGFEKAGVPVVYSEPFWLDTRNLGAPEAQILDEALARKRPSRTIRLKESWVVYEVLAVDRGSSLEEEFKKARAVFEEQAGEGAFAAWLAELRLKAKVEYNPAFSEIIGQKDPAG